MNYYFRTRLQRALITVMALLICALWAGLAAVLASPQQQNVAVSSNEGSAMKSVREVLNAEVGFQNTAGKGEYGDLKDLYEAGLINRALASGIKDGYVITIVIKKSTISTPPMLDIVARPGEYGKTGRRSFYLTESGVLLTSEVKDAPLTSMQPFATGLDGTKAVETPKDESEPATEVNEDEIASNISANEASTIATLAAIHAAETKYISKVGAVSYGTLDQLEKAGLIEKARATSTLHGYQFELAITPSRSESPAMFRVSAVPRAYGVTGRRAFFMDQTGIVRGDDKEGGNADATDPPIK